MLQITSHPSPNFNDRSVLAPSYIVLHYTGMKTAQEALERLCNPQSEVSAHYFVDEDGRILQLVNEDKRAWHAGKSYWSGESDLNSASIGIEIVNPGHELGYRSFTAPQIKAVADLCGVLIKRYKIPKSHVLAHADIAPERKEDPGELFPWRDLASRGVGLWAEPDEIDLEAAEALCQDKVAMQKFLCEYGYDPDSEFSKTLIAYHRHYYPEKFLDGGNPAEIGIIGAARLLALIKAKHLEKCLT